MSTIRCLLCILTLAAGLSAKAQVNVAIGETIKVSSANELSLAEDLNNNGTIDHLTLTGTAAQSLSGTGTIGSLVMNKESGTATIASGMQTLTGVLRLTSGLLDVGGSNTTAGHLTMKSDINGTARVESHTGVGTGNVTGFVKVERWIDVENRPNQWRTLGFPYSSDMPLSRISGMSIDYTEGRRSMMHYNEGSDNGSYTGTSTARNAGYSTFASDGSLAAGKGVMAWLYGNSGGAASAGSMTGTLTVSSFGELNESGYPVSVPVTFSGNTFAGWNLVSNPFASAIDWSSADIVKISLSGAIYRWKPASESWTTWSEGVGSEVGVSSVIESGGSFFVKATGASPSLTIPQTAKSEATGTSSLHFAAVPQRELRSRVAPSTVRLAGVRVSVKGQGNPLPDAVYLDVSRGDATSGFDAKIDATSMGRTSGAGIALMDAKDNTYAIQFDAPIKEPGVERRYHPLRVTSPKVGQTTLELWTDGAWDTQNSVSLIDKKEGKTYLLQGGVLTHSFNMTSLKEEGRFILAINHVPVDKSVGAAGKQLMLLGNPVTSEKIDLLLAHPTAKPRRWELISMQGAKVAEGRFDLTEGNVQYGLQAPGMRASGVYVLRVELDNGEVQTVRVMRK